MKPETTQFDSMISQYVNSVNIKNAEEIFDLFLKVVTELKGFLDNQVSNMKGEVGTSLREATNTWDEVEFKVKGIINGSEGTSLAKIRELSQTLSSEIDRIESLIPEVPSLAILESKVASLLEEGELTPEKIRNKLETLTGDNRLDKSAIKGLEEEFKALRELIGKSGRGGGGSGGGRVAGTLQFYDLSSQTTGSLKVFTVPKSRSAVVMCSDFPSVLMENNGFTMNAKRTQLTLTVTNAPSSGSQLLFQYVSLFNIL